MSAKQYVYAFDCVNCYAFYGENSLTKDGDLFCPECGGEQSVESDYVERIEVLYQVEPYVPTQTLENENHRPLSAWRYPCQCECGCEQGYDYSATAICSECQDHTQQGDNE